MARKTSSAAGATRTKAAAPKATAPKAAVKKPKASNSVAAETAAKSDTPKVGRSAKSAAASKPTTKKSTAKKPAVATKSAATASRPVGRPKKVVPAIKLNDRQREFLSRIKGEEDKGGYFVDKKIELRTLDALRERKLVKRGAKDKEKGTHPWTLTKLGEKTLTSATETAQPGA